MTIKEEFDKKIKEDIKKKLGLKSVLAVPKLEKIILNMGIGNNRENKIYVSEALLDLTNIAAQKVSERKARLSVSNFKLRKGQLVGLSVTLRGEKMWGFYEKLVRIAIPRVKDFNGLSRKSFDGAGNFSVGLKDYSVFPEIDANKITYLKPMQVVIVTNAKNNDRGYELLKSLYFPFKD